MSPFTAVNEEIESSSQLVIYWMHSSLESQVYTHEEEPNRFAV